MSKEHVSSFILMSIETQEKEALELISAIEKDTGTELPEREKKLIRYVYGLGFDNGVFYMTKIVKDTLNG